MFISLTVTGAARFVEVSSSAGIDFTHDNGKQGEYWMVEVMGGGVGLLDFDNDGRLDLWLVQGGPLKDRTGLLSGDRLFLNVSEPGELQFVDITETSQVVANSFGMGIAKGDIDNDGDLDVLLANFGKNQLFENLGDGRFRDITDDAGLKDDSLSIGASFADIDDDGYVDLYVVNYQKFTLATHKICRDDDGGREYCGPQAYLPEQDRLYRNLGDGRFEDITRKAGILTPGNGLGVVARDFNNDGMTDFYVANDASENFLWLNQGAGRFVDDALFAGAALNVDGLPEASMGVAAEDFDLDGDMDLFMTHLKRQSNTLYVNNGNGWFTDNSNITGVAVASIPFTGFGAGWIDIDNDGDLDLFTANGEVSTIAEQRNAGVDHPLRQRNQLWLNNGQGYYEEVSAFVIEDVSRGAAFGDLDNDGDTDIVVANNDGKAHVYHNDSARAHWLGVKVRGSKAQPLTIGTYVWREDIPRQRLRMGTDGSYASANDPRRVFGLADTTTPQVIWVEWPDGSQQRFGPLEPDRYHLLERMDILGSE